MKLFIEQCKSNPSILSDPSSPSSATTSRVLVLSSLPFLTITQAPNRYCADEDIEDKDGPQREPKEEEKVQDELIESSIEIEGETVEPHNDPPQMMGDPKPWRPSLKELE
ncbi:FAM10 family protein At4g22670 isoform X2 [Hevea brasiliensis]|uniref:FAM10 family protein At4g22670 isoform X2 n=1 Tax=Hevea brasiliensis TaxID=3981 RepID=UPI0025EE78BA|nr:FAM10 family protein At4g22670 isoform X2 [Hevea brasiliensis]